MRSPAAALPAHEPGARPVGKPCAESDAPDRLSISQARRCVARELRALGFESPELDARLLVGHALGLDHTALAAQSMRVLSIGETRAITTLARRRLAHEPVARILGRKEFWGLSLRLNAETLVPRPETEAVVEAALTQIECERRRGETLRIADLGTGSGALLLALLCELPAAGGIGTDISLGALGCAHDNAATLGCSDRASFLACHYGSALRGAVDLMVSNPPYIAREDIATLPPEVRDFDPRLAFDGGLDGLDGYRAIAADALRLLAAQGILVVELGWDQLGAVTAIFGDHGLAPAMSQHDLSGVARALVVRRLP